MKFATNTLKQHAIPLLTVLVALLTLAGMMVPYQDIIAVQALRIISGSIFILFLPGYFLTRAFFRDAEIDFLERFALSFALSIAVVPLLMFYANLLGLPITALSVYGITLAIIILSSLYTQFLQRPL